MKTTNQILSLFIMMSFMLFGINNITAQTSAKAGGKCEQKCTKSMNKGQGTGQMGIPDLTPEQEKKIDELKTKLQKDILPIKLQLQEKKAHLKVLESAETIQLTAINATIDEITLLENKKMKLKAQYRQDIRSLLTEKQRLVYDTKCMNNSNKQGQGNKANCSKSEAKSSGCCKGGGKPACGKSN